MKVVNYKMIAHPMNWITFLLMVIIAGSIGHMLLTYLGIEPALKQKLGYGSMPAGQSPGDVATGAIFPSGDLQTM